MQYLAVKDYTSSIFDQDYNYEYYLIRRLNHRGCQHVIHTYDQARYKTPKTQLYFRMAIEFCDGGDLDLLRKFYLGHESVSLSPIPLTEADFKSLFQFGLSRDFHLVYCNLRLKSLTVLPQRRAP